MKIGFGFCIAALLAMAAPAAAQDTRGLAPADKYFGHYKLSVLGIANAIRDAGARIDSGNDSHDMIGGPLSYVSDAVKDWQQQYPSDPWIAKDLLALESVYLRIPTDEGFRLASQTEAWLVADYPNSDQASDGRSELALNRIPYMPQELPRSTVAQQPAYAPPPEPVYVQQQPVYVQQPIVVQQPVVVRQTIPSYAIPWDRYTALRAPYYPSYRR